MCACSSNAECQQLPGATDWLLCCRVQTEDMYNIPTHPQPCQERQPGLSPQPQHSSSYRPKTFKSIPHSSKQRSHRSQPKKPSAIVLVSRMANRSLAIQALASLEEMLPWGKTHTGQTQKTSGSVVVLYWVNSVDTEKARVRLTLGLTTHAAQEPL